ncbi:MAG: cupredoxin domain-containing protein [Gammaproteobacteria bacterium]|nr:cupredoxin domain-containing protein [Gammaproteobacteria bacterium]MBU6509494.1 cupredoxin domain-containing protein [Gammaproteobacteria bacterium]MDE1984527.1 cupredoxin domain-containing protein [Gammaproteobacteria bacterium]MDE2108819.1 cupredoxin domain-containing protein [Gammaproteobacteria bacterium]MDE2460286.1 cupredoxin domain-containing protein [Gammaproteobacteria bacterium]
MRNLWISVAVIAWAALAGSAVAAGMSGPMNGGEHFAFGHPGAPSAHAQVIHIKALDFSFEPKSIAVRRGETVEFVISNDSKLTHEFVIGDAKLQAAHEKEMQTMPGMSMKHDVNGISLAPGQTRDLVWTFTRDGVVEYACHVPGHFAAGMVGKIIIH